MRNEDLKSQPRRLTTLWLVAAVCAFPFVGSFLAYYLFPPGERVNYGELLADRRLPDFTLPRLGGGTVSLADLKGKWWLVQVDSGLCPERCRTKLYQQRQVRLAQGKNMDRVERLWLTDDGIEPEEKLRRAYDGTWIADARGSPLLAQLPAESSVRDHVYLVDPLGNVVLRFPADADPARMVKDLSRLLRASRIG
jgi:cytochrome oxidase Cu insertion factor (SCO1/SenC/PrrC family)